MTQASVTTAPTEVTSVKGGGGPNLKRDKTPYMPNHDAGNGTQDGERNTMAKHDPERKPMWIRARQGATSAPGAMTTDLGIKRNMIAKLELFFPPRSGTSAHEISKIAPRPRWLCVEVGTWIAGTMGDLTPLELIGLLDTSS